MQILQLTRLHPGSALQVAELTQIGPLAQWTMDCKLFMTSIESTDHSVKWSARLDVGLSNNAVASYALTMGKHVMVSRTTTSCKGL